MPSRPPTLWNPRIPNLKIAAMSVTINYHLVFSGFSLRLPGDERGYWSEAWDEMIGYNEPHMLHPGDPIRKRMAEERMQHPRVVLNEPMIQAVIDALDDCHKK